jgi:5-methylcytosine-specific restriction endonuclease McrA
MVMKEIILTVELIPQSCWFSNVRSAVSKKQWDTIRYRVYSEAYHICQICGGIGPQHPVEAHEIWEYDDKNHIQKLIGMVALCPACHRCKHFGLAQVQGKEERALTHLMKVNRIKRPEALKYLKQVFTQWAERSTKKWELDISYLSEYGIDISKIEEKR